MSKLEILIFLLDEQRCAVRLGEVREIVAAVASLPVPKAPEVVQGVINVRGEITTLLDIRRRLGLQPRAPKPSDHFLLSMANQRPVAISVDRVLEIVPVSEEDIIEARDLAPDSRTVAGVVKLPDGLILIHSLADFLSQEETAALEAALAASSEANSWAT